MLMMIDMLLMLIMLIFFMLMLMGLTDGADNDNSNGQHLEIVTSN